MDNILIMKQLDFEAGHKLNNHTGRCRSIHGHHYVIEIFCTALELDQVGRVIDFGVIKQEVGTWIDMYWDHAMLVEKGDSLLSYLNENGMKYFELPYSPTAENLATFLFGVSTDLLSKHGVTLTKVRVWETPRCYAESTSGSMRRPR